jgi:hypothetical protein
MEMGIDFVGNGGFVLSWSGWGEIYDLACSFGWEPAGTRYRYRGLPIRPDDPELLADPDFAEYVRDPGYFSNDEQLVTEADAAALAAALRRALAQRTADPGSFPDIDDEGALIIEEFIAYCGKPKGFAIF